MLPGIGGVGGFFGALASGGSAAYLGAEDTTGGTFTSSTLDALTVNGATLKASTDYLLFASADLGAGAAGSILRILNGATALYDQNARYEYVGTGDGPRSLFFMRKVTTSASPSSDNWILRLAQSGSGQTITWDNARLVLLEVGANDNYAENRTRQTWTNPTSATAQTACTLNFTPGSSGRYLILGFLNGDISSGTHCAELTDGTNTTGEIRAYTVSAAAERIPQVLALELTLSGSTTFTLKARNDSGSGTLGVADCCIIAIRLDRFVNSYGAARSSQKSNGGAGYEATPAWVDFTPNAADHLTLAFGGLQGTGTCRLDDNGTIIQNQQFRANYANASSTFFTARIASFAASQRTQKIEHNVGPIVGPTIFTFDLGAGSATAAGSVAIRGHAMTSGTGNPKSLTLPAGSAAGDLMFLFNGDGWAANSTPSGWQVVEQRAGTNWNGITYMKILTAADITAGSVSISFGGNFNGIMSCIVFQGRPRLIRAYAVSRNGAGASSRTLTTDSTPRAGDYFIGFGSERGNATVTCDVGSALRQVAAASASGALYGGVLGSDGAVSATFSYASSSGDYQVVLIVSP